MADKEFLERMLSMLPEEFQDVYDDTIPEAKEIRKKMEMCIRDRSASGWLSEDLIQGKYEGIVAVSSMQLVFDSFSIWLKLSVVNILIC